MKPFYEHINERTGRKERVYWDEARTDEKLQEIRQKHKDFLNARDVERARAAGIELPDDAKVLPTMFLNADDVYEIDPIASRIKHSGAELNDMWIPEWQTFCSSPQSDEINTYPKPVYVPKEGRKAAKRATGTAVVASDIAPRKPGRPRKQEMLFKIF